MTKSLKWSAALVLMLPLFANSAYPAQITLSWDPVIAPDIAGYRVYYGTSSRAYDVTLDVGNWTSVTIADLKDGGTYYFAVTAYDLEDNESGYSSEVCINCASQPVEPDSDGNNMPDTWEVANGFDPLVDDASDDADGDRYSNLQEYLRGTDPTDPKSHPPKAMPWLLLLLND